MNKAWEKIKYLIRRNESRYGESPVRFRRGDHQSNNRMALTGSVGVNTTTYSYNLRNWQTKQSSPNFTEELFYTSCPHYGLPEQFGGNIIAKQWTGSANPSLRGMTFVYDPLDRITNSNSGDGIYLQDNYSQYGEHAANRIYGGNTLTRLLTQEGYVDRSYTGVYSHCYYLKDYQSNNRMVLNSSGGMVQRQTIILSARCMPKVRHAAINGFNPTNTTVRN